MLHFCAMWEVLRGSGVKSLILRMLILKEALVWCAEGGSPIWSGFQDPGDEWRCEGVDCC